VRWLQRGWLSNLRWGLRRFVWHPTLPLSKGARSVKITVSFDISPINRDALLTALATMLRSLPVTVRCEIVEQRKSVLVGGDVQRGQDSEGPGFDVDERDLHPSLFPFQRAVAFSGLHSAAARRCSKIRAWASRARSWNGCASCARTPTAARCCLCRWPWHTSSSTRSASARAGLAYCRSQAEADASGCKLIVTNYEMASRFDPSAVRRRGTRRGRYHLELRRQDEPAADRDVSRDALPARGHRHASAERPDRAWPLQRVLGRDGKRRDADPLLHSR
jgi:hypothetical protein